jgi:plasmid stabilization system protein ParE
MKLPVLIMPDAEDALRRNAKWWADNRSAEQAERWYDGFAKAIIALGDHPLRYPLARENDQFPYDVRVMNYGVGSHPTHRALYTVRPDAVVVLSIRSCAQQDVTTGGSHGSVHHGAGDDRGER